MNSIRNFLRYPDSKQTDAETDRHTAVSQPSPKVAEVITSGRTQSETRANVPITPTTGCKNVTPYW